MMMMMAPPETFGGKMAELESRRSQLMFAKEVCVRRGALRRTTTYELDRVSKRGKERALERVRAARRRAQARNAAFLEALDAAESRVLRAQSTPAARDFAASLRLAYSEDDADEGLRRRERLEEIRSLEEEARAIGEKAKAREAHLAKELEYDGVITAKKIALAESEALAAERLAALEKQRIDNAKRDAAVVKAFQERKAHADPESPSSDGFSNYLARNQNESSAKEEDSRPQTPAHKYAEETRRFEAPDSPDDDDDDDEPKREDFKSPRPDDDDSSDDDALSPVIGGATAIVLGDTGANRKLKLDYSSFGSLATTNTDGDDFDDDFDQI